MAQWVLGGVARGPVLATGMGSEWAFLVIGWQNPRAVGTQGIRFLPVHRQGQSQGQGGFLGSRTWRSLWPVSLEGRAPVHVLRGP